MFYYLLVNNYGGVPLVTEYASTAIKGYPRATAEQVYTYIIDELKSIISNNRLTSSSATKGGGEASIEAAKALLAKTYLSAAWDLNNQSYFTEAAKYADEVINGRSLTTEFADLYPAFSEIQEYLDKDGSKPFLLVEYCHSMGNGPGDFEDYFQMIQDNDKMCGGFVWEWCDHAIAHGTAENGKTIYAYGGDHGEEIHDGNFCMDGLVYPDRTVHTGLLEYKNVYRPARVISYDKESGELVLHNYMDFDNLKDYVKISYELTQDGLLIGKGKLAEVSVVPHSEGKTNLQVNVPENGKCYLKLIYHLKKEMPLLEEDYILGFDEIEVSQKDAKCQLAEKWVEKTVTDSELQVSEDDTQIHIKGREFAYTIDRRTALFTEMKFAGREYLNHPMELNIWRAPTDNDMYIKSEWKKAHYDKAYTRAYTTEVVQGKHGVKITSHASVVAETVQKILDVTITWKIEAAGKIDADIAVTKDDEFPDLPRFGVRMFLDKKLSAARYFGMGPQESYCDKHQAASHGLYQANVDDLHEDYIRPQENGKRNSPYDICKTATGHAKIPDPAQPGKLKVSFFLNFYSDYYVMELDQENYNYALIGSSTDKYLWILSRTPQLPEDIKKKLVTAAERRGYDTNRLQWIEQL